MMKEELPPSGYLPEAPKRNRRLSPLPQIKSRCGDYKEPLSRKRPARAPGLEHSKQEVAP